MLEMGLFISLVLPLPFTWRRAMLKFLAESPIVAKLQFGLKILFIFVVVLFVDAVQHMLRVHAEGKEIRQSGMGQNLRGESDWRTRKFLSERNMYLTGSTLFLSLMLSRVYAVILDLIKVQEDNALLRKQAKEGGDDKYVTLKKDYDDLSARYNAKFDKAADSKKAI
ncbi:uncharacterized protein L969DRAFT_84808 [Mixia osmundae IAM 14324]|nr:uncharacterized protein L969DRAFT_84808 [Mixia osmundae IAM 14324]KEI42923.1 hypothetical protein L969DRAFT_84808 [Mixia osmundae IAM 14324]